VSSTFALTVAVLPAQAYITQVETAWGSIAQRPFDFTWTGTLSGTETWTATYRVQISSFITTAYPLTNSVRLTAPGLATLVLTPTVIVNGQLVFLPVVMR
jgi:hypothetical protein